MMKTMSAILILISLTGSIYYMFVGLMRPETALVYNKAGMSHLNIQLLSVFLGFGGMLLLFPQTFRIGGVMLIMHSLATIACFIAIRDWKGGFLELIFLQIPVIILWAGYPKSIVEKLGTF